MSLTIIQQHSSTYQRKGNQELEVQLLNMIVAGLQTQVNNISTNSPPPLVIMEIPIPEPCNSKHNYSFDKKYMLSIYTNILGIEYLSITGS